MSLNSPPDTASRMVVRTARMSFGDLGRAKTGPLCDPLLEVLQAEGLAPVAGSQGLLERLRKLSGEVGGLPSAQSFRQRLEGGRRYRLGAPLVDAGTLSHRLEELVVTDGLRLPVATRARLTGPGRDTERL